MSRGNIVIIVLILIFIISSFWLSKNKDTPPWMKCKESLFNQIIFKECTPSFIEYKKPIQEKEKNSESE